MKRYQWLFAAAALLLAGCSNGEKNAAAERQGVAADNAGNSIVLLKSSTPAEVNCVLAGGTMATSRQLNGASVGTCQLANGKRCDEQALLNGTCPAG
ncbi:DUF333 domain-containing protein [Brenneria corticis]|uniref:DUF333 domain-containing protein n=1 Tax=Brenneria corticis TaxID=2173106 RepID=A0A2U1U3U7_9GAMM|nr:DUF333 domain-containing protein [Brenneria sp. CFCC 11842]PWC16323.1 DUF333 domain-containing protein [Brenneria sp. CFCC 11842]